MNKVFIGISIILLLSLVGYCTLTLFSSNEIISNDFASVTIKNESGNDALKVVLKHARGTIEVSGLKNMDEVRLIFRNMSENSYNVTVTFDNSSTLTSTPVYIERGYRGIETMTDSEIITNNNW